MAVVAVVLVLCSLAVPVYAPYVTIGALAVVVPNSGVTLIMQRASPGALVMFAMVRSVVMAFAVVCALLVFKPATMQYLLGVGLGLAVTIVVPITITLLRPTPMSDSAST